MFGLRARYDFQANEEIRSHKEVIRVGADGTFTCRDSALAAWAQRDGFDIVVDLDGKVSRKPIGLTASAAAKKLGVLVPTVNVWARNGKLRGYFIDGKLIGFADDDVRRLVEQRA